MAVAVYSGTFDPVTLGHLDLIERASRIFERLYVVVALNTSKESLFSPAERVELLKEEVSHLDNIIVESFSGLLVDYVRKKKAHVILRGLRTVSDFEHEFQMAQMNRTMDQEIETMFLLPGEDCSFISSRLTKEIASLGGEIDKFVTSNVEVRLRRKLETKAAS